MASLLDPVTRSSYKRIVDTSSTSGQPSSRNGNSTRRMQPYVIKSYSLTRNGTITRAGSESNPRVVTDLPHWETDVVPAVTNARISVPSHHPGLRASSIPLKRDNMWNIVASHRDGDADSVSLSSHLTTAKVFLMSEKLPDRHTHHVDLRTHCEPRVGPLTGTHEDSVYRDALLRGLVRPEGVPAPSTASASGEYMRMQQLLADRKAESERVSSAAKEALRLNDSSTIRQPLLELRCEHCGRFSSVTCSLLSTLTSFRAQLRELEDMRVDRNGYLGRDPSSATEGPRSHREEDMPAYGCRAASVKVR